MIKQLVSILDRVTHTHSSLITVDDLNRFRDHLYSEIVRAQDRIKNKEVSPESVGNVINYAHDHDIYHHGTFDSVTGHIVSFDEGPFFISAVMQPPSAKTSL